VNSTAIPPQHPRYPTALAERGPSAPTLYVRGTIPDAPGVAVVGTREPSPAAVDFTRALVLDLAERGLAIWSGGAIGIDAAAHEAALEARAPTVVVMGGGLDQPYPKQNIALFDRVLAAGGALVSRAPDAEFPSPARFHQRNELLAALSAVTVVIEAGEKSGARSTAAAARRLGRPLGVVPQAPWEPRGTGCALELAAGAHAVVSAEDVLALMGLEAGRRARGGRRVGRAAQLVLRGMGPAQTAPPRALTSGRASCETSGERGRGPANASSGQGEAGEGEDAVLAGATPAERAVFAAIAGKSAHADELCERTALSLPVVLEALLTLTLRAIVVEGPAGLYQWARRP